MTQHLEFHDERLQSEPVPRAFFVLRHIGVSRPPRLPSLFLVNDDVQYSAIFLVMSHQILLNSAPDRSYVLGNRQRRELAIGNGPTTMEHVLLIVPRD